ncbi:MAG: lipopolysaccharide biosynthesis protein RfbH [Actinobacteria bacterium]|nr:lipopolysaccharide biosynthesis protein RfbH [Actinomycetota bacterium]MCG2807748.1 lipopolysaccharide biosynthesis protein RfbH [Coriobacteriia bacterium]
MSDTKRAQEIRQQILALTREYHAAQFSERPVFEPGVSRVTYASRVFDEQEMENLVDSSLDFWLTYGRYSQEFESGLARFLGIKHALLVNSGSSANLLAFAALTSERLGARKVNPGDEVITVAAGFPTTVAPIVQYGAVPVFVDVTLGTYNIDVSQLKLALSPKTKAVMLAHTLGNPFDIDAVRSFCNANELWLIEDNCDALGGEYRGRKTGTFGDIGTSSFYPPHHMTMGEGGAVYTDNDELAAIMLSMRDWGRDCICPSGKDNACGKRFDQQFGTLPHGYDHKYVYSEFGFNLKATDMQAAIGVAQLEKLPEFTARRRENYAYLREALRSIEDILIMPQATEGSDPSWFGYLMTVRDGAPVTRDALVSAMEAAKIQTRMLFAGNIVRQPAFDAMRNSGNGYRVVGELVNTDRIMNDSFWIGVFPGMSDEMLAYMAQALLSACGR